VAGSLVKTGEEGLVRAGEGEEGGGAMGKRLDGEAKFFFGTGKARFEVENQQVVIPPDLAECGKINVPRSLDFADAKGSEATDEDVFIGAAYGLPADVRHH